MVDDDRNTMIVRLRLRFPVRGPAPKKTGNKTTMKSIVNSHCMDQTGLRI